MTDEAKALHAFLLASMDGGMSGQLMSEAVRAVARRDGAMNPTSSLRGIKYLEGRAVQVGKAERVLAHGTPSWLCQTQPPFAHRFEVVTSRVDAVTWLRGETESDEVFEGDIVATT